MYGFCFSFRICCDTSWLCRVWVFSLVLKFKNFKGYNIKIIYNVEKRIVILVFFMNLKNFYFYIIKENNYFFFMVVY